MGCPFEGLKKLFKKDKIFKKIKDVFIKWWSCYEMLPQRNVQKRIIFTGCILNHLFKYYLFQQAKSEGQQGEQKCSEASEQQKC